MASRSTPRASRVTAIDRPARSLPAEQCISAGEAPSESSSSTRRCSAVRVVMINRYESIIRCAARPSPSISRSVARSPSRTMVQNPAPSAGSDSGRLTVRTPGSATSGPSSLTSAELRKSKTVCSPSESRNAASVSVACARWPLRNSTPRPTCRPSTVGRPPTSRKLRTPVSSGSVDGTCGVCCVTGAPSARPPAPLVGEADCADHTTCGYEGDQVAIGPVEGRPGALRAGCATPMMFWSVWNWGE